MLLQNFCYSYPFLYLFISMFPQLSSCPFFFFSSLWYIFLAVSSILPSLSFLRYISPFHLSTFFRSCVSSHTLYLSLPHAPNGTLDYPLTYTLFCPPPPLPLSPPLLPVAQRVTVDSVFVKPDQHEDYYPRTPPVRRL